jgi:Xaa-Pro aminopeptidase
MMLNPDWCAKRQERLRQMLDVRGIEIAFLSDQREIFYLTGLLLNPAGAAFPFPALLAIETNGDSWLACHTDDGDALVDERLTYEPNLHFTINPNPLRRLAEIVAARSAGGRQPSKIGYQAESLPHLLADTIARVQRPRAWVAIDDEIAALEKRKDPDEIELLQRSIHCTLAAYDAAKAAIEPGVNELAVQQAGHMAATFHADEVTFHNGDYQSAEFGGFARDRQIEEGEFYIIDAWSTYHGYWSDLCRTFPVGEPSLLQRDVHNHVAAALLDVQAEIRPGRTGDEIWRWLDKRLREHPHLRDSGLTHHAGHGIGLRPHEAPDLNRDRGGLFEPGEVICVEPGAYAPDLRKGVRLENTFLITESGCQLLSKYPVRLGTP